MPITVDEFLMVYDNRCITDLASHGPKNMAEKDLPKSPLIAKACQMASAPREALMTLAQWKKDCQEALELAGCGKTKAKV